MAMIKGIPVVLLQKIKVDEDPFGQAIYREREIIVENVLVSPSSANDIITSQFIHLPFLKVTKILGKITMLFF